MAAFALLCTTATTASAQGTFSVVNNTDCNYAITVFTEHLTGSTGNCSPLCNNIVKNPAGTASANSTTNFSVPQFVHLAWFEVHDTDANNPAPHEASNVNVCGSPSGATGSCQGQDIEVTLDCLDGEININ